MTLDLATRVTGGYPADLRGAAGVKIVKTGLRADLSLELRDVQQLDSAPLGGLVPVQDPVTGRVQALNFEQLPTAQPGDGTVGNTKLTAAPALTVKGNATEANAQPQDVPLTTLASTGNPIGDAIDARLAKTGGTLTSPFALDAGANAVSFASGYFAVNSRGIYGVATDWLGNSATGGPTNYGYGSFAAVLALSPIGDVGISAATRTDQITTSGRLPVAGNFQAFNFKTNGPQTAWAIYAEARRKKGAGQIHGLEVDVTDLGDGSDFIVPTAKGSGAQAVFGAWQAGVSIAAGGNIKPGQQTGWDGTQNISQASNCGVALNIYSNGAQFAKGIIIGENALIGVDGTGGSKTGTAIEMCRGGDLAWIDGTTRQGSRIRSDVSSTGPQLTFSFSDFGYLFNGGGANTLQIDSRPTDVNGLQIIGATITQPVRLLAAGTASSSLSLECAANGAVFIPNLKNAANDAAAAAAGVPNGGIYRNGSVLMIRVA